MSANAALSSPTRSGCQRWKGDVLKWFSQHPEVSHVFAAQLSGGAGIRTSRRDKYAASAAGPEPAAGVLVDPTPATAEMGRMFVDFKVAAAVEQIQAAATQK